LRKVLVYISALSINKIELFISGGCWLTKAKQELTEAKGELIEEKEIKFIHKRSDDYKLIYANGVFGGPTPRGEIVCHFFVEAFDIPESQTFELTKEGKIGKQIKTEAEKVPVTRELKVGIVLRPDVAENVANWLIEKVKKLKVAES